MVRRTLVLTIAGCLIMAVAAPLPALAHEEGIQELMHVTVDALPVAPTAIELARLTFQPGSGRELVVPGAELFVVEAGTPSIRVTGLATLTRAPVNGVVSPPEPIAQDVDVTLGFGDQVLVYANVPYALFNDGIEAAALLDLVFFPAASLLPSWLPSNVLPPGVGVTLIAADVVADPDLLPGAPAAIALSRVAVAGGTGPLADGIFDPGAMLSDPNAPETQGLVALNAVSGQFALVVIERGVLAVERDAAAEETFRQGEVVRFAPGVPSSLRNGSESVLVAMILTIDASIVP